MNSLFRLWHSDLLHLHTSETLECCRTCKRLIVASGLGGKLQCKKEVFGISPYKVCRKYKKSKAFYAQYRIALRDELIREVSFLRRKTDIPRKDLDRAYARYKTTCKALGIMPRTFESLRADLFA